MSSVPNFIRIFALTSAIVSTAANIPTESDCVNFANLTFDLVNVAEYHKYFHDQSTLTLSQAGTYTGPDGIAGLTVTLISHIFQSCTMILFHRYTVVRGENRH